MWIKNQRARHSVSVNAVAMDAGVTLFLEDNYATNAAW
jgi:hypothetical protein